MRYVCDASNGRTWFRIETEAEAEAEAAAMRHAVDKYFNRYQVLAQENYRAPAGPSFEQAIGLKDYVARVTPLFLTLRADDGEPLVTAMLPPQGRNQVSFRVIIVGRDNADPYPEHEDAILALALHYGLPLEREDCYPY